MLIGKMIPQGERRVQEASRVGFPHSATELVVPAGTFWWLVTIRSLSRWSEHRSANSTRRLPVQGSAVTILGRDCGDHYRIEVCEILYHQYVVRRLKGALMSFKPNISRIIHRVMPFIGLRGSLVNGPPIAWFPSFEMVTSSV
jgi:hypothetical protein